MSFIADFRENYVNKNYDWDAAVSRAAGEITTVNKVDNCCESHKECHRRRLMNSKKCIAESRMVNFFFVLT